jgi:hypothetical protein
VNVVLDVVVDVNVHVNGGFHSAKTWSKKQDSANLLHQGHGGHRLLEIVIVKEDGFMSQPSQWNRVRHE